MEYRILGPVAVGRDPGDGADIVPDGAKPRTVLAALLLAGERPVSVGRLTEYLWGEDPPTTYIAQIHNYVSRLRRSLGAVVERRPPGYRLLLAGARFDLVEFDVLAQRARQALAEGRAAEAAAGLGTALSHWRGPALSGVTEHLAAVEAPRLEEARITVLEQRIRLDLDLGRHGQMLPELAGLVRRYPLREAFRAQLMTAYYRCDRQAEALAVYDEGRRLLADELGIDPGATMRGVHRAILAADPRLLSAPAAIH